MIGRFWRGWATAQHARAYEELFRTSILPGLRHIDGFAGAYVLRRDAEGEVEIMTITLFESQQAIQAFAGNEAAQKRPVAFLGGNTTGIPR